MNLAEIEFKLADYKNFLENEEITNYIITQIEKEVYRIKLVLRVIDIEKKTKFKAAK